MSKFNLRGACQLRHVFKYLKHIFVIMYEMYVTYGMRAKYCFINMRICVIYWLQGNTNTAV